MQNSETKPPKENCYDLPKKCVDDYRETVAQDQ